MHLVLFKIFYPVQKNNMYKKYFSNKKYYKSIQLLLKAQMNHFCFFIFYFYFFRNYKYKLNYKTIIRFT